MSISLFCKKLLQFETTAINKFCSQKFVDLNDPAIHRHLGNLMVEHENLLWSRNPASKRRVLELKPVVNILQQSIRLHDKIVALRDDLKNNSQSKEINKRLQEKAESYIMQFNKIDSELQTALLEPFLTDGCVLLEMTATSDAQIGVQFAKELFDLYLSYAQYRNWEVDVALLNKSYFGGYRKAAIFIEGIGVPELMRVEAGVHHVRRIPDNEEEGRLHSSTVSVSVLPQPTDEELSIPDHDLKIITNYVKNNQVRITHIPTKTVVECREGETKLRSLEIALQRLRVYLFQKQKEGHSKNQRHKQICFGNKYKIIRTYNYEDDCITEHRKGCGPYNLRCFMENVDQLEQLQKKLLRYQKYQDLMRAIDVLSKESQIGEIP